MTNKKYLVEIAYNFNYLEEGTFGAGIVEASTMGNVISETVSNPKYGLIAEGDETDTEFFDDIQSGYFGDYSLNRITADDKNRFEICGLELNYNEEIGDDSLEMTFPEATNTIDVNTIYLTDKNPDKLVPEINMLIDKNFDPHDAERLLFEISNNEHIIFYVRVTKI